VPLIEGEDTKMNQMMRQNYSENRQSQLHALPEGSITADTLASMRHTSVVFSFFCAKTGNALMSKQY